MSDRHSILVWSEQGAITDTHAALGAAGVLPATRDWRTFLDRLLLWSGAVALVAGVVFFVAYNWNDLGKFAKFGLVGLLIVAAVLGYWRLGVDRAAGKASLLVASILLGALLALFGQTYQTGADTWELFANWAALMAPWVLVGRFAGLWMLWIMVANVAIVLYFQVFPSFFGIAFSTERQVWALFAFNTAVLVGWELAARRVSWLDERWAPRLLAITSGAAVTLLMVYTIYDWRDTSGAALIAYPAWIACAYGAYRARMRDLFVLSGGCLSVIVVVTAFLARHMLDGRSEAAGFLLIAIVVIGLAAASGAWLKQVASEERE
jgi:uncharacterized membrane protein